MNSIILYQKFEYNHIRPCFLCSQKSEFATQRIIDLISLITCHNLLVNLRIRWLMEIAEFWQTAEPHSHPVSICRLNSKSYPKNSEMSDLSARARPRKTLACVLCRSRKVKCSGEIPCKGCVSRGIECVVIDGKKRGPPLGYVRTKKIEKSASPKSGFTELPNVFPPQNQQAFPVFKASLGNPIVDGVNVEEWDHSYFRGLDFEDEDGSRLGFIDYYFKWVHMTLPFLSKDYVEDNFHLLPLYLLHSMYASITVTPYTKAKLDSQKFLPSFTYAKNYLMHEVEELDPFMICALIHIGNIAATTTRTHQLLDIFARVLGGCLQLGMHLDLNPIWNSNLPTKITDINFSRSMWFYIYAFGYQGDAVYDLSSPEVPDISLSTIEEFISPNCNHATNIPQK